MYLDEFEGENWNDMTVMENVSVEHTWYAPAYVTDDLKIGDIFESKVKLLRALCEWSIVQSVSFEPIKMNKKCYIAVCDADDADGGNTWLWRVHASDQKESSGYFKIKIYVRTYMSHTSISIQSSSGNNIPVSYTHLTLPTIYSV